MGVQMGTMGVLLKSTLFDKELDRGTTFGVRSHLSVPSVPPCYVAKFLINFIKYNMFKNI